MHMVVKAVGIVALEINLNLKGFSVTPSAEDT